MKLDLDTAIAVAAAKQQTLKWELVLTLDGVDYRVRPLTNADVQQLAGLTTISKNDVAVDFLLGLFDGAAPPVRAMVDQPEKIGALILGVTLYVQEHLKKKSMLLASAVQGQIALATAGSTAGS